MRLLLIRHGQTPSNVLGQLDSSFPGPGLTELGAAQADAIPVAMAGRAVSSITVSNFTRTRQTAEPLAKVRDLRVMVDPGVGEIPAGEVEMRADAEALRIYTEATWGWGAGELDRRIPGSEDGHEFFARFDAALEHAAARGEELPVVVSHAGAIRAWVGLRAQNVGPGFAADSPLHNTGWALLDRAASGAWTLEEWHADPMGGAALSGPSGPDPTGGSTEQLADPGR